MSSKECNNVVMTASTASLVLHARRLRRQAHVGEHHFHAFTLGGNGRFELACLAEGIVPIVC